MFQFLPCQFKTIKNTNILHCKINDIYSNLYWSTDHVCTSGDLPGGCNAPLLGSQVRNKACASYIFIIKTKRRYCLVINIIRNNWYWSTDHVCAGGDLPGWGGGRGGVEDLPPPVCRPHGPRGLQRGSAAHQARTGSTHRHYFSNFGPILNGNSNHRGHTKRHRLWFLTKSWSCYSTKIR